MANTVTLTFAGDASRLEKTFDRVGAAAKRMGKDVGKTSAIFDDVSKSAGDAGDKVSQGFMSRFGTKLTSMMPGVVGDALGKLPAAVQGPAGIAALAIVGAMGPILFAGLSSAVLLGLGGGVLALGIMQAVKDPKVAAAWKGFGDRAKKSLSGFTDAFKGPVTRAAKTFGDAIERMEPAFTRIGQTMAPIIDKLAPALADMAERAMPGIEKAIKASGPLFEKLAEHLPKIGDAVSSFFDSISDSGPGALIFIDLVLTAFEGLIRFWGNGIEFWSNTLEVLNTFFTEKVPAAWNWLVDKIKTGADKIGGFFTGVKDWIVKKWDQVVSFVSGLPKRIGKAASGMWDGIKNSFRAALNWVINKWNNLEFRMPGITFLGQTIGGWTLGTPNLPTFHSGTSAVPGSPGENVLAVLQAGEQVKSRSASMGGNRVVIELNSSGSRLDDLLVEVLARAVRVRGGNVQLVLGGGRG